MKTLKTLLILGLIFLTTESFSQKLPDSYQALLNEVVIHFETIRSGNSVREGKNSIRLLSENKIILSVEHKKKRKNLTFVKKLDENNETKWLADNQLTIDMVNKYEEDLTKFLQEMYEATKKKSQE